MISRLKYPSLIPTINHQSLVGPVVIGAGLGREDHSSIPATAIGRGLEPLDVITDPRTGLVGSVDRILVVVFKMQVSL